MTTSPVAYPHVRVLPDTTIADLSERFESNLESLSIESGQDITIAPDRTSISVGSRETPFNEESISTLGNWVGFPKQFLARLDPDLQANWLNELLHRKRERAVVRVGERSGIASVLAPNQIPYSPDMIVDVAGRVLGTDSIVVDAIQTATEFDLDVIVPVGRAGTDLGDPRVGDIVKAGLRFNAKTAQNLAPTVQPYSYRLWCSNGASSRHDGTKIDARGQSVDEVMAELEEKARLAFSLVEREVDAMYALRDQVVANPERTINRIAREHSLSDRLRLRLIDTLPSMVADPERITMFDIVQAATHMANAPEVRNRGTRESLELFGGTVAASHVERCVACQSKLN